MPGRGSGVDDVHASARVLDDHERRRDPRSDAALRARVRMPDPDAPVSARARVLDISGSGVRLQLRRRLPVGARVVVDLECELPIRVHLGFDAHSLVVDGPMHSHTVGIDGTIVRSRELAGRRYDVGIEFHPKETRPEDRLVVQSYVDHLRDRGAWSY
jgi:hypothetical protein